MNPNIGARGVYGNMRVTTTIDMVAMNKFLPGRLLTKGLWVRITNTIKVAEMTDSTNQLVRNWVSEACKMKSRAPKVR